MHEGVVMQAVVKTILEAAKNTGASRVANVELMVGISGHFTEEAIGQYFQVLTRDTPAEGATLTLSWLPATYQCLACQQRFESSEPEATCPTCGDVAFEISHQDICYPGTIDVIA